MPDELIINATSCSYRGLLGEHSCKNIRLKLPQSEVVKLQSSVVSQDKPVPDIDYSVAAQFWGLAFTTTFFLWLFAKGIGEILKQVKNV